MCRQTERTTGSSDCDSDSDCDMDLASRTGNVPIFLFFTVLNLTCILRLGHLFWQAKMPNFMMLMKVIIY